LITARALQARRDHDGLFARGTYRGVAADGACDHVVIARRELPGSAAVAIVTRRPLTLARGCWPIAEVWGDTTVALDERASWRDVLTGDRVAGGRSVPLREVLRELPVALLLCDPA
jgi:(1->4)-alpha-D-glucan 1-alpha-D-glucosylmutase